MSRSAKPHYLGGHGGRDNLQTWTKPDLSFDDLAAQLRGDLAGRLAHFGACETANDPTGAATAATSFRTTTGALGVSGYSKSPDWIESAAFEVLLFAVLAMGWQQWGSAYKYVLRHYAPLADLVGFTTAPS